MRSIRRWLVLVAAVAIACCGVLYCHITYFFNPLTFRNNNVVYLPFNWYKNPMQIEVWGTNTPSSPPVIYTTFDQNQIRFVFRELESGQVVDSPNYSNVPSSFVHITIRTGASRDASIVQDAMIIGQYSNIAKIGTQVPGRYFNQYITITPALQKWVETALEHGKLIQ